MAIPEHIKTQFDLLCHAARGKQLALMECADKATGEARYVLAAIVRTNGDEVAMMPFGHMSENTSEYVPPVEAERTRAPAQTPRPKKPVTDDIILRDKFELDGFTKPTIIKPN